MTTYINAEEAVANIAMCFKNKLVPMITGSPGIGKSAIVYQVKDKYRLHPIDIRLSQCDPTDMSGLPSINGKKASYRPMDIFPLENDPIPDGCEGFVIFLDEINSASMAVQAASYKLVLDRMVGQHKLHPKTFIVCAGNLMTDGAIVNRLSTAMQSRLIHFELRVDWKMWSLWASANKLATEVISYINHQPGKLMNFDPNHNDKTFASPRTWEFASRIMLHQGMSLEAKLPALSGCVGEGIAYEFVTYCEVYKHIPTYKDILANPRGIHITNEPMMLAALSGMVGSTVTVKDLSQIMPYIHRLPLEFQVFALRDATKRNPLIKKEQDLIDWLTINAEALV